MSSKTTKKATPLPKSFGKIIGGRLDLSNKGLTSLKDLGVQPSLEVLVVSNNNLRSFESLQPQRQLSPIIIQDFNF